MKPIITERLIIRNFNSTDWKDLKEYLSYEDVIKYSPYVIYDDEMAIEEARKRENKDEILAVVYKESNKVIGELIFEDGEFDSKEIGFFFNPQYQGKGLAKEGTTALMNWAYNELEIRRLTARCDLLNIKSQILLERLGMRREGILRKHIYFKNDKNGNPIWADTCLYAMLAEEWNSKL
jgi:[ribosomal protein S5]-alanine N-acetyltransferase